MRPVYKSIDVDKSVDADDITSYFDFYTFALQANNQQTIKCLRPQLLIKSGRDLRAVSFIM